MTQANLPAWARLRVSRRHEKFIQVLLFLCAALSVLTTAAIILVLLGNAVYAPGAKKAFFEHVSVWEFLTGTHWKPVEGESGRFGILPLLSGTVMVAVIASLNYWEGFFRCQELVDFVIERAIAGAAP